MGKGDKKSRRGKVNNGSYGKRRMRKASVPLFDHVETAVAEKKEEKKTVEKEKAPVKKAAAEPKAEKVEKPKKAEKEESSEEKEAE